MKDQMFQFTGYQPEKWIVLKDSIYAAQTAIKLAIEYIEAKIVEIETLPRLSLQHQKYLEIVKNEKVICVQALEGLKPCKDENTNM